MKPFDRTRFPLMGVSLFVLLAALWGGLLRIGWRFPALQPLLPAMHGALMVSGFLGTLIAVERAVAFAAGDRPGWIRRGAYIGPALTGLAALLSLFGVKGALVAGLLLAGSLCLVAVYGYILKEHPAPYTIIMALGTVCWAVGNAMWFSGLPIYRVVEFWGAFLVLTIVGERLELGRLSKLPRWVTAALAFVVVIYLVGLFMGRDLGRYAVAVGFVGMAVWLFRFDITRVTVRKTGLPRFVAVCLLAGYAWMLAAGILLALADPGVAGLRYDAYLHAVFVGFVMSMIFGHAPIIFPALTGRMVNYHPRLYWPLGLLHLSLMIRWAGDLIPNGPLRTWGGMLNAIAVLAYLGLVIYSMIYKTAEPRTSKR